MKKGIAFSYGLVKQAHIQKKVYCEVKNSKHTIFYLKSLRKNSFIYGYSIVPETNRVFVYLRYYRNRPTLRGISLYSKQGHKRYITKKNIFKISRRTNPGNSVIIGTSKTSTLEITSMFKHDKYLQFSNSHYGELMSMVW